MFAERSDEWLTFRKRYISATEAASIVGLNSYMTANQMLHSKRSTNIDKIDNMHLRDGLMMEPAVFKGLSILGWDVKAVAPEGHVLVYTDEENRLSATPDNFRWDIRSLIEVKKTSELNFYKNWMGGLPPLRYLTQTQVQMHTTGFRVAYLVCTHLEDNIPLSVYKVNYSPEFMELLIQKSHAFWKTLASDTKRITVSTEEKEFATGLLKDTYTFEGIFRHGGLVYIEDTNREGAGDVQ